MEQLRQLPDGDVVFQIRIQKSFYIFDQGIRLPSTLRGGLEQEHHTDVGFQDVSDGSALGLGDVRFQGLQQVGILAGGILNAGCIGGWGKDIADIEDAQHLPVFQHRAGVFIDAVDALRPEGLFPMQRLLNGSVPAAEAPLHALRCALADIADGAGVDTVALRQGEQGVTSVAEEQNADVQLRTVGQLGDQVA